MLGDEHLKLRLNRLQSSESWVGQSRNEGEFTIVFFKAGIGKYVAPDSMQRLISGSILVFNDQIGGKLYAEEKNEPARLAALPPQSSVSANSTISARVG